MYAQQFIPPNADGTWAVTPLSLGTVNSSVDVFVVPSSFMLTPQEISAVQQWVSYGRGIVVAGSAWDIDGYQGLKAYLLPANQLLAPFGIQVRATTGSNGCLFVSVGRPKPCWCSVHTTSSEVL